MTPFTNPWLGPVLVGGVAVLFGLSLLLYSDQRRTERLSMRLRIVQPDAAVRERETESSP